MIYIINFHHVLNYGAVLQGYALSKVLLNKGYNVQIIDYRPSYFLLQIYRPSLGWRRTIRKVRLIMLFSKFRKQHLRLTQRKFIALNQLIKAFKDSNAHFICGSDQIWNSEITNGKRDGAYFLDFVSENGRKISYAASIGNSKFQNTEAQLIVKKLKSYKALSVREEFAQNEVLKISEGLLNPKLVLDPSLLLTDYTEVIDYSAVPEGPYLAVYTTEDSDSCSKLVSYLATKLEIAVVNLGHYKLKCSSKDFSSISPSKWLGIIAKAKMVITNSFHGTAYSIVFKRDFFVLARETKKELNERQKSLLRPLNLMDRYLMDWNEIIGVSTVDSIKYEKIYPKLEELRKDSLEFLINAVNN